MLYEGSNQIRINYGPGVYYGDQINVVGIENAYGTAGIQYDGLSRKDFSGTSLIFSANGDFDENDPGDDVEIDPDMDHDDYPASVDCDDHNPAVHPGATDICGDGLDNDCSGHVDDGCSNNEPQPPGGGDVDPAPAAGKLYFPLIPATCEVSIGLLNSRGKAELSGVFKAYDDQGGWLKDSDVLKIPANGRLERKIGKLFGDTPGIAYLVFVGEGEFSGNGYCRIVNPEDGSAAAYPACSQPNGTRNLYLPHLMAAARGWSTEVAFILVGGNGLSASLYYGAETKPISLPTKPNGQTLVSVESGRAPNARIKISSLPTSDSGSDKGIVGVVLYRHAGQMAAARLQSRGREGLVVPYLLDQDNWWSSEVFYNSGSQSCSLKWIARTPAERSAEHSKSPFDPHASIALLAENVGTQSYALELQNECDSLGIGFLGQARQDMLGAFAIAGRGQGLKRGVFAYTVPREQASWSGLVLYNPGDSAVEVSLQAYNDQGVKVGGAVPRKIPAGQQLKGVPEALLDGSLKGATHIAYDAEAELFGLLVNYHEVNGREMLEVLPPLQ